MNFYGLMLRELYLKLFFILVKYLDSFYFYGCNLVMEGLSYGVKCLDGFDCF